MRLQGNCGEYGCWVGELAQGCKLCKKGLKSVLFITGLCLEHCYYCPISFERRGKDVTLINDLRVRDDTDILLEVLSSRSRGIGITGGDPLLKFDKLIRYIKLLKEFFGKEFHIHLYTTGLTLNDERLNRLVDAGLDEIRFHITGNHSWQALERALDYSIDVGIENPVIPDDFDRLKEIILKGFKLGVKFINMNELEFSESNYDKLLMRGMRSRSDSVGAIGSEDTALRIMEWIIDEGININLHYCPARFKDKYQFRLRLSLRAKTTLRTYETLSDSLVKWAEIIECPKEIISMLVSYGIAFKVGRTLVTNVDVAESLPCRYRIIEAYPLSPRRILNIY